MYTETLTQRQGIINGIVPQSLNNARLSTGGVDMKLFRRAMFTLYVGTNAGNLSAWLQESADNASWTANDTAGTFANSGAANVSQTGITGASTMVTFEVNQSQLTNGKRYVRLQIKETNVGAAQVCVFAEGDEAQEKPGNANNGTQVGTQNVVA